MPLPETGSVRALPFAVQIFPVKMQSRVVRRPPGFALSKSFFR